MMGKDKTIQDLKVDAHIAVLHTKVDSLIDKQKELTERVRANEKVVAAVTLLGTVVLLLLEQVILLQRQSLLQLLVNGYRI